MGKREQLDKVRGAESHFVVHRGTDISRPPETRDWQQAQKQTNDDGIKKLTGRIGSDDRGF